MEPDALLAGLNPAQLEAVTADGGLVVVLAGAGSGKTRVLTRRIAWRVAQEQTDPQRILALTFTRKAADELRSRLGALGMRDAVAAGTFHATALLQLRQRWAERGVEPPTLLRGKIRFVGRILSAGGRSPRARIDAADAAAELDWARARLVGPADYPAAAAEAGRTPPGSAEAIAELLERYQTEKRRKRVVDFDDLLMLALRDLRADRAYAEAVRWRHRHFYVDEFQDVNPLQYELLSEWRGERDDLFVVGDPNQAIYGWNGADPALLDRFVEREPTASVIELRQNYRSSPQILALAASLTTATPLEANRPDGPVPALHAHPDDAAEAAGLAAQIRQAHSVAGQWSDQAVLVRTNAQLAVIEQVLTEAGIPARLRGGSGPLATPEVRSELKVLSSPGTDLVTALDDLDERLDELPTTSIPAIERRANLAAFVRLVHEYVLTDPHPTGPGLAAWIGTLNADDLDAEVDAVDLITFHAAKGLEWPVVHIAGLEEGFVPIAYATTGGQLAEERRLLYVAVTRAMEELHLNWAAERTFSTRPVTRQASPHLGPLADTIDRLGVGPLHRVDWRSKLAESRRSLLEGSARADGLDHAPDAGDNSDGASRGVRVRRRSARPRADRASSGGEIAIYRALEEWRRRRALVADVTPNAVFADHVLRSIAATRPVDLDELAELPGMGPAKLHRYGSDLLEVVAEAAGGP